MQIWSRVSSRLFAFLGLAFVVALLPACQRGAHFEYRYRVTVNVDVGGKIYTGSSVQETQLLYCPGGSSAICVPTSKSSGEAPVVDVGGRGYLFMLLNYGPEQLMNKSDAGRLLNPEEFFKAEEWAMEDISKLQFATFTNINDPKTVKTVTPKDFDYQVEAKDKNGASYFENGKLKTITQTQKSNFAEFFGPDAKLVSVTIKPTKEPVTRGKVEGVIPWIAKWDQTTALDGVKSTLSRYDIEASSVFKFHFMR